MFVPVVFTLLPDKKRESYDAMFSLLKENLECRGLEMSATYFMSDFEIAIKDSFLSFFPDVDFSKAIISKVARNGFKADNSKKDRPQFSSFLRAILGLGYVPLERFREGLRNLYILAKRLTGKQRRFAVQMIDYVLRYWVNGSHPPSSWVMYKHGGAVTNNHSKGYNSIDDSIMERVGNENTKRPENRKEAKVIKMREKMLSGLEKGNIDLLSYQQSMGGSVCKSLTAAQDDVDFQDPLLDLSQDEEIIVPGLWSQFLHSILPLLSHHLSENHSAK